MQNREYQARSAGSQSRSERWPLSSSASSIAGPATVKTTVEKKLHALGKLLQAIDALKEKQRTGVVLDAQQQAKLAREPTLRAELADFTAQHRRESGTYRINCFWFKHYDPRWQGPQPRLKRR